MTRTLREALHEASDDSGIDFRLTPDETLELARRRTRHVRWSRPALAVAAVAAVAAAVLVLPQLLTWPSPDDDLPATRPPTTSPSITRSPTTTVSVGSPIYNQELLTPAQVKERCSEVFKTKPSDAKWVLVPTEFKLTPGQDVTFSDPKYGSVTCLIPREWRGTFVHGPLPKPSDEMAIKRTCSAAVGEDLTGWRVVRAATANGGLTAVLASANGWDGACIIMPETWKAEEFRLPGMLHQDVKIYPTAIGSPTQFPSDSVGVRVSKARVGHEAGNMLLGAGTLMGKSGPLTSAASIKVTDATGKVSVIPVVEGRYAFVMRTDTDQIYPLKVVVRDAKGVVLQRLSN